MKSNYCGEITSSNLNEEVTICGWIHRRRDHGGVIFLDVRDIKGICQAVVNPDNQQSFQLAETIRNEFVVQISGIVRSRLEGTVNKNMHTGEIEIEVKNINGVFVLFWNVLWVQEKWEYPGESRRTLRNLYF